jgi:hypothetical protein
LIKQALKYAGIGIACLTISPWFSGNSGAQERLRLQTLEDLVEQTLRKWPFKLGHYRERQARHDPLRALVSVGFRAGRWMPFTA